MREREKANYKTAGIKSVYYPAVVLLVPNRKRNLLLRFHYLPSYLITFPIHYYLAIIVIINFLGLDLTQLKPLRSFTFSLALS